MNVICIGAHPDDCEVHAGGTAVKWVRAGHRVQFVSMTNGDIGHHEMAGGPLAQRRTSESERAAQIAGLSTIVLDHHDGELEATLELRREVVRLIRAWRADLVLTHRPNDYHPDHRYTSIAVQDAAFMVTVPHFCPDTPRLEKNPVFMYMVDRFQKPMPFSPDVAVAVDDAMEVKAAMLDAMESQMYEWLPWLESVVETVPEDKAERRSWLARFFEGYLTSFTEVARPGLERWYGSEAARATGYAECFELSEYGHQPDEEEIRALFPFLPKR